MQTLKQRAVAFLQQVAAGELSQAYTAVADNFVHHNPWFASDADSLRKGMTEAARANPHKLLEIQRALEEADLVAVHSRVRQSPDDVGGAVVHIFRFEGDKIAELWDVGQAQPSPEDMVNEQGMF